MDKKTGKKININVYIFKHDFGICFLYRNKTNNQILNEKINIENNTNIEFSDDNKPDINNNKEIKICVEPHKDYFLKLKSKNFSWKVNPVFSYSIETIPNVGNEENEKSESNSPKNFFVNKKKLNRNIKTLTDSNVSNLNYKKNIGLYDDEKNNKIDENENENDNENDNDNDKDIDNENDNEESIENDGDSSDINISDDNSDETI